MKKLNSYSVIIFAFIIIVTASLVPGLGNSKPEFIKFLQLDKVAHFGMYFSIVLITLFAFSSKMKLTWKHYLPILFIIVFASGLIEFAQEQWASRRGADFFDFLANCFGAVLGLLVFKFLKKLEKLVYNYFLGLFSM